MNWPRQVLHVAAKDARQFSRLIIAYTVLAGVAVARPFAWPNPVADRLSAIMFLVMLLGMIAVASFVHGDSPTAETAFWASRPLYSSAVLAAKVMMIVVVMAIGVSAEDVGLVALGVPSSDVIRLLCDAALVFGAWMVAGLVAAGLTQDLRGFVTAMIAIPLAWIGGVSLLWPRTWDLPFGRYMPVVMAIVGPAAGIVLLAYLYRTRRASRGVLVAGSLSVSASLVMIIPEKGPPPALPEPHIAAPPVHITAERHEAWNGLPLNVSIAVDANADSERVVVNGGWSMLHGVSGDSLRVWMEGWPGGYMIAEPAPALGDAVIGAPSPLRATSLRFVLDDLQREHMPRDIASIDVHGTAVVSRMRVVAKLPVSRGARMDQSGLRVRIVDIERNAARFMIDIAASAVESSSASPVSNDVSFVLVNDARGETVALSKGQTSSNNSWLALPGVPIHEERARLTVRAAPNDTTSLKHYDDAWLAGARLAVVRWERRGSFTFNVLGVPVDSAHPGVRPPRRR